MAPWSLVLILTLAATEPSPPVDVPAREAAAIALARAGDHAAATIALQRLQLEFPRSERACLWQEWIFRAALATDDPDITWDAARALVARWDDMRESPGSGVLARVCRDDVSGALRHLATRWHDEGIEHCDDVRLELAERAYRTYLAVFPTGPDSYDLQFYFAELLRYRAGRALHWPDNPCRWVYCGTALARERQQQRERGERIRPCAAAPALDDPPYCAVFHDARAAYIRVLERDPHGRHTVHAAHAQLVIAAFLSDHHERERGYTCRHNRDGLCVVPGSPRRRPICDQPTLACHPHLEDTARWPTATLMGLARVVPLPRAP